MLLLEHRLLHWHAYFSAATLLLLPCLVAYYPHHDVCVSVIAVTA